MAKFQGEGEVSDKSEAARVEMPELTATPSSDASPFLRKQLDLIRNVKVRVSVCLGEAEINVGKLFDLRSGDLVPLDRRVNEPLDLFIDGKLVARGELVVIGDSLGLRVLEIAES